MYWHRVECSVPVASLRSIDQLLRWTLHIMLQQWARNTDYPLTVERAADRAGIKTLRFGD